MWKKVKLSESENLMDCEDIGTNPRMGDQQVSLAVRAGGILIDGMDRMGHSNHTLEHCDCARLETRWDQNGAIQPLCTGQLVTVGDGAQAIR